MDKITLDRNAYNFQTEVRARLSETDAVGIVFFGSFSTYMDVGRMDYLHHLGLNKLDGGVRDLIPGAVVHSSVNFKSPARYNDVLLIHVRVSELGESSYTFNFMIEQKRDRTVVATGRLTLVWLSDKFEPIPLAAEFVYQVQSFEKENLAKSMRSALSSE